MLNLNQSAKYMKRICATFLFFIIASLLINNPLQAQDNNEDNQRAKYNLDYRTFRVALIPGLSTNGLNATNYASKYSFNILAGYHGALDDSGFEFGSLINANKYYAHGVQIAGLGNYSGEETAGIQLAGIGTLSEEDMQGIQLAGAANISGNDMQGIQLSGLANISRGYSEGLQSAGLLNTSGEGMQGLFSAGIGNISGGEMQGLLFSGIFNIAQTGMQGITASGVINYAKDVQGIALSSVNISKEFQGIHGGLLNIAEEAQGFQVGLLNYAREFQGVPVGLISYYGNGRLNMDIWGSDGGFTNYGLKLGTNEIYNMISVGYNPLLDRNVWQLGWSIGRLHEYQNHFLYTDFSYFKINEGGWTKDLNSNFKYRLLFGKNFDGIKLYGGPTFNMLISRVAGSNDYAWYRLYSFGAKGREYSFWTGLSVGIELF